MRQPQSWALRESFPQLLLPTSLGWSWQGEERAAISVRTSTGSLTAPMDCCWKQYWWWVFWSQFPRLPPEATADVFCHGGGGGQKLESQPNRPTQLQSLDSNYPSLRYNLSSPGLYSPDPMPGSLFPRHLHFSCLPAWLVACLFYISPFVPSIPHLCHFNSQPSDTKTFISLILQFPIIMYTDFSTVAHSFTIPYFDQFKKYNRHKLKFLI